MRHLHLYALAAMVTLSITCASKPQPAAKAEADKVAKVIGVDPVKQSPLIVNCFGR